MKSDQYTYDPQEVLTREALSPDGNTKVLFFEYNEVRMGAEVGRVRIEDLTNNKIVSLDPLWTQWGSTPSWSMSSNVIVLTIIIPQNFFLLYNINDKTFAIIKFEHIWVLDAVCSENHVEITFRSSQIPERVEHHKYPTKQFEIPASLKFEYSKLEWMEIEHLSEIPIAVQDMAAWDLKPIDMGWRKFIGQFPQTTEILICELQRFAEYGDGQSKEWLKLLEHKAPNFNIWKNASLYIGIQQRR